MIGETFRSLRNRNYRVWAMGAFVSNIGTWMQRIAQDWLVLTELTDHSASAVGIVMALQFGPQVLLLPITGFAADHFNRRKLLFITQASSGTLALGLGALTITHHVHLWHVYAFAFVLGCVNAFDAPTRQIFVSELVGDADLSNAIGLNSTSFNAARMIGPAVAGAMIALVGSGWVFVINATSFVAMLIALARLRLGGVPTGPRAERKRGSLTEGFRYVWGREDLIVILVMVFLIGTFGLNFPIYISTMAVSVFHVGAGRYGVLTSMLAIGSVTGALLSARRPKPYMGLLVSAAAVFGVGCTLAGVMPTMLLFGVALMPIGIAAQTFSTSANSLIQLASAPEMRGRVIAIWLAIALGGTPIGAPIVGWIADHFGPRMALGVGALAGISAAVIGLWYSRRGSSLGAQAS